jgi:hypothetical protein
MEEAENNRGNETRAERFKRLATQRTNAVMKRLRILGNCSNRQPYEYTKEDIDKIFAAIDRAVKETRARFRFSKEVNFKL